MPFGTVTSTFVIGMSMLTATMVGESRYLSESARRAVCGRARDERERVSDVRTRSSRKKGGLRGSALGTRTYKVPFGDAFFLVFIKQSP